MRKRFRIEVDCANCANKMERIINNVSGIRNASINFMALKLDVEFEDGVLVEEVMNTVLKECKKVERDCEIYF
ncbi:MAG: cation transporter [Clostridia bacterium]|nr:cation transporter [Clostridia bacterium]